MYHIILYHNIIITHRDVGLFAAPCRQNQAAAFLIIDQTNTQLDPACQGRQELGNLMKKEPIMALAR